MQQLKVLRELGTLMISAPDPAMVIQMVLEGMCCGVGFDRICYAAFDQSKSRLAAKLMLGANQHLFESRFKFELKPDDSHFLVQLLANRRSIWLKPDELGEAQRQKAEELFAVVGRGSCFLAPLTVSHQPQGLFYADRRISGRELDADSFEAFAHFARVAEITLEHLKH